MKTTFAQALAMLAALPEPKHQAIGQRLAMVVPAAAAERSMTIEQFYALPADEAIGILVATLVALYRSDDFEASALEVAQALQEVKWR